MRLLDADVLIDVLWGNTPPVQRLTTVSREEIGLSGLVVMELLEGCPDMHAVRQLQRLLAPYLVYWPTEQDCDRALAVFARAHLQYSLGLIDALIGECAVELNVPLVTFNVKHFQAITTLTVEQPYERG